MEKPMISPHCQEAESNSLHLSNRRLLLFACFGVWQMGVVYFSNSVLSLRGRSLLPAEDEIFALLMVLGYLTSAVAVYRLRRHTVALCRWILTGSLAATALSFLPFGLFWCCCLFYIQAFCCVFLIGGLMSIVIPLFQPETELRDMLLSTLLLAPAVLLLQNNRFPLPFWGLNLASLLCQALLLWGLLLLPQAPLPSLRQPKNRRAAPRRLTAGFFFLIFLTALLTCFGSAVAENTPHGLVLFYGASLPGAGLCWLLWQRGCRPTLLLRLLAACTCAGFVLAVATASLPALAAPACLLLGLGLPVCLCGGYLGVQLFRRYPSPWLATGYPLAALAAAILHSLLLDTFRNQSGFLLSIYGITAALLLVGCFFLEAGHRESSHPAWSAAGEAEAAISTSSAYPTEDRQKEPEAACAKTTTRNAIAGDARPLPSVLDKLAPRERELADLVLQGYTQSDIARIMTISIASVSSYRKRVYQKLDIHSRQELFHLAESDKPAS